MRRLFRGARRLLPGVLTHVHLHGAMQQRQRRAPAPPTYAPSCATPATPGSWRLATVRGIEKLVRRLDRRAGRQPLVGLPAHLRLLGAGPGWRRSGSSSAAVAGAAPARRWCSTWAPTTAGTPGSPPGTPATWSPSSRTRRWSTRSTGRCAPSGERRILPLVMDLADPSPGGGWRGVERAGFAERARADVVLALAVVHHLAIGRNVPLPEVVDQLAGLGGPGGRAGGGVRPPARTRWRAGCWPTSRTGSSPTTGATPSSGCSAPRCRIIAQRGAALRHPDALPGGGGWLSGTLAPPDVRPVPAAPTAAGPTGWRAELGRLLEVVALVGLVVTQPLLDVLGRSPDFFLFHRADRGDILLLVALVAVVPDAAVGAARRGQPAGRADRPAGRPHRCSSGCCSPRSPCRSAGTVRRCGAYRCCWSPSLAGAAGAAAHRRWRAPGRVLRVAARSDRWSSSALFLFASPASAVVLPRGDGGAAGVAGPGRATRRWSCSSSTSCRWSRLLGPDGKIDAARYPHFAELAGGSTWYRNATGVSGWTPVRAAGDAHRPLPGASRSPRTTRSTRTTSSPPSAACTTSAPRRASPGSARPAAASSRSAPEQGLGVLVRESGKLLRQVDRAGGQPRSTRRTPTASRPAPRRAWTPPSRCRPTRSSAGTASTTTSRPGSPASWPGCARPTRPTLHFLHLLMPHSPWAYLPSGARYDAPEDLPNDGAGWVDLARQRHLAQLGYTDRLIGETLRTLRATGLYDQALRRGHRRPRGQLHPGLRRAGGWTRSGRRRRGRLGADVRQGARPARRRGSTTATGSTSTCCPPSPTRPHVRIPWRVDGRSARQAPRERADKRFYDRPGEPVDHPRRGAAPRPAAAGARTRWSARRWERPAGRRHRRGSATSPRSRAVDPDTGELPALVWGDRARPRCRTARCSRSPSTAGSARSSRWCRRTRAAAGSPRCSPTTSCSGAGANRLDVYRVGPGGTLRRLTLS